MARSPQIFDEMRQAIEAIGPELKKKFVGIVQFDVANVGSWTLDLKTGNGSVVKGKATAAPDLVIEVGDGDFAALYEGKTNAQQAFMKGKLKVKGNMSLAMKFNTVLTATRKQLGSRPAAPAAKKEEAAPAAPTAAGGIGSSSKAPKAAALLAQIEEALPKEGPELVKKMKGVILFDIDGEKWLIDLKNGNGSMTRGEGSTKPDLVVSMSDQTFFDLAQGKVNSQQAFMKGKIKLKGAMPLAMKLNTVMAAARPRARL